MLTALESLIGLSERLVFIVVFGVKLDFTRWIDEIIDLYHLHTTDYGGVIKVKFLLELVYYVLHLEKKRICLFVYIHIVRL